MSNTIKVSILGEVRDINNKLGQVNSSLSKTGKVASIAGKVMGAAFAAGAVVAGVKSVVSAASDAQQSLGATQTVFGKYSQSVISDSKKAATQFGLDANTYRENANLLGSLFSNQGVASDKLAGSTKKMIGIGADLAATFGGTTTDAVGALGAAFKGEYDQMERFGVSLKESTVSAELAARGQDKLTGAALAQAKQQVVTDLIMKQSSKTRGAFAKETDTLAHQQQVLSAQFTNLKATLGTALLPVITAVLTVINNNFVPAVKAIGTFLAPVIAKVKEFFSGLGAGSGTMTTVMGVFKTLGTTITQTIIPAVTQVATYIAGKLFPVFTQIVGIVQGKVIPIFAAVATFIYGKLVPAIVAIVAKVAGNLKPVFDQLVATFQSKVLPAINKLLGKFQEWGPTIAKVVTVIVKIIGKVLEFASAILGKVLPPVIKFAGFLIGTLFAAIGVAIGAIVKIIGWVIDFGAAVIKGATKVAEFANKVNNKIQEVIGFFIALPGKIKGALSGAGTMLVEIGKNIVQGLANGIESAKQWVLDKIQAITDSIPNWVKKRLGIASPSRVMAALGKWVSYGLAKGVTDGAPAINEAMKGATDIITSYYDKKIKNDAKAAAASNKAIKTLADEAAALRKNADARKVNNDSLNSAKQALYDLQMQRYQEYSGIKTVTQALEENKTAIDDAKASLSSLKQEALDYATTIKDNVVGVLVGLGKRTSEDGVESITSATYLEDLRQRAADAQKFSAKIAELNAMGLNEATIKQMLAAGVEGGLATAEALAAGGAASIAEANALTAQITAVGQNLGDATAQQFYGVGITAAQNTVTALEGQRWAMYNAGINAAQGLVDGFEALGDKLEKAGEKLAKKMVKAIKKALDINSPSRVFKKIGEQTTDGLVIGLKDTQGVERATTNIGRAMERTFNADLHTNATAAGNTGGKTEININVTAPATVDKAALGREITSAIDSYYKSGGRRLAL